MTDEKFTVDQYFIQLIYSLQAGAMQQMGKIANPMTGQVERDLSMAQHTIAIIEMLEKKTKGNVSPDEEKLIGHILYELRLNYVDEVKKADRKPETDEENTGESPAGTDGEEKKS